MLENQSNPNELGSEDFFDNLEHEVNGLVLDDQPTETTPAPPEGPTMETLPQSEQSPQENQVDWEKRYKDSSREAIKMRETLNDLKPFVPVLDAMKRDSGLVEHVRDYLTEGRTAKTVTDKLNLPEDFVYDPDEAVRNPDSDSAKVFKAHVDTAVQTKVNETLSVEREKALQARARQQQAAEVQAFKEKYNMSDEQIAEIINGAKQRRLTLEDLYYIQNKDKTSANVARATKDDMMQQMKNVRNIPTSASGVNSPQAEISADDQIFNEMMGSSPDIDSLFNG